MFEFTIDSKIFFHTLLSHTIVTLYQNSNETSFGNRHNT